MNEAILLERAILAQSTINYGSNASVHDRKIDRAGIVRLIEKSEDFIAGLELSNTRTNSFNGACTIGAGNNVVFGREGIFALGKCLAIEIGSWKVKRSQTFGMMRSR